MDINEYFEIFLITFGTYVIIFLAIALVLLLIHVFNLMFI
jgi:hypothetical protein